jgi:DNA polymerase III subunit chi
VTTRVNFYVLSDGAPDARLKSACRLAEEAAESGAGVYLLAASEHDVRRLDDLLWTYNDRSFLPHEVFTGEPASHERVRVLLGLAPAPDTHRDLLINVSEALPAELERYAQIAEIVDADPERKKSARERYRLYRERGCGLQTHNM